MDWCSAFHFLCCQIRHFIKMTTSFTTIISSSKDILTPKRGETQNHSREESPLHYISAAFWRLSQQHSSHFSHRSGESPADVSPGFQGSVLKVLPTLPPPWSLGGGVAKRFGGLGHTSKVLFSKKKSAEKYLEGKKLYIYISSPGNSTNSANLKEDFL